ncbi:MAG: hypothetical protein P8H35_00490 [Flavobacteriales bacterium]|nr:hypothetical protein [Flavobacteriales bacterium]
MSIASQAHVNVLNGTIGSAFVDGRPAGDNRLIPSIPGNALDNPTFDVVTSPPFGNAFNGVVYFNKWSHFGQLFTSDSDYKTYVGNSFHGNFPPFKDLGGGSLDDQPKVLKLYGAGTNFPSNTTNTNNNNARSFPLSGMSFLTTPGTYPDGSTWTRQGWSQGVAVPDSATTVTFGAYVRVPSDDQLRDLNVVGCYINQNTGSNNFVNAMYIKEDGQMFSFKTGSANKNHWSGLSDSINANSNTEYSIRENNVCTIQSITPYFQSEFSQFKKIEKTVTLQAGSNRRLTFEMFFGENQDYLNASGTPSGAGLFYNPFVTYA